MHLQDIEQAASLKRERDSRVEAINKIGIEIDELDKRLAALGVRFEATGFRQAAE